MIPHLAQARFAFPSEGTANTVCGTAIAYGPGCVRDVCGTEIAYGRWGHKANYGEIPNQELGIVLSAYARATRCPVLTQRMVRYNPCTWYDVRY
eukprot:2633982-Rhodomonas_salina.1